MVWCQEDVETPSAGQGFAWGETCRGEEYENSPRLRVYLGFRVACNYIYWGIHDQVGFIS